MPSPLPLVVLLGRAQHVDGDGGLVLSDVPPGRHHLVVQALGQTVATRDIVVRASQTLELGDIPFAVPREM